MGNDVVVRHKYTLMHSSAVDMIKTLAEPKHLATRNHCQEHDMSELMRAQAV
jgi:hypothetical protein